MRLDTYLAQHYPQYSRSTWQKYIKSGFVKVNDEVESSPKRELGEDDHATYDIQEKPLQKLDIPVIYEDQNVAVIDKPAGILSHSKGTFNDEPTVATWLSQHTSSSSPTPKGTFPLGVGVSNREGIVHRLDRDTSGVMIVAKNSETATLLQKQFSDRKVKKKYIALVKGTPKHSEATIDLPIERNPKKPSQFRVGVRGKAAVTKYKVTKSNQSYSLVELKPASGRTHQLRVHLAYLGTPIIGDRIYGKATDRMYLHATSLEVTIPPSRRRVFTSALPSEFDKLMKAAND